MPQTEPMTPEAFALKLQEFGESLEVPKLSKSIDVIRFYERAKKDERTAWVKLIAQRDREILTKAADTFREWARNRIITDQYKIDECAKAILAPLGEKEGN